MEKAINKLGVKLPRHYAKDISKKLNCTEAKVYHVAGGRVNDARILKELIRMVKYIKRVNKEFELLKKP